ncbi:MAG: GAF domain-containing protein [Armatimonadetes bacterium]|nr:GAF domain-containing protein [Armatimonadota bacterium]
MPDTSQAGAPGEHPTKGREEIPSPEPASLDAPAAVEANGQERRLSALRALVEAGIAITSELSLAELLQRIVDVGRGVVHARYAALGVVSENGASLTDFVASGMSEEEKAKIGHLPTGRGILGALLKEAKPLRLRDLTRDPRSSGFPPHHPKMRSFLGVPVVSRGRVFGRLYFTEKEGAPEFSEEDESLAASLASQAAAAIENARLFRELAEQQERLVRAERLSAIGALASTVGHELRNPLSIINNAVFFLNAKVPRDDPRVARNLDILAGEVRRTARIIDDLLDFSRVRPPQLVPLDVAALVRLALERQPLPENVRVHNRVPAGLPRVCVDPTQMQQVLTNLIANAVEAMPQGGDLSLEGSAEGEHVVLRVTDTGVGIPPENRPRLFEPLFTTKARGVGLGLSLVRRVVDAHHAEITVESEVGKGATFTLRLPAAG